MRPSGEKNRDWKWNNENVYWYIPLHLSDLNNFYLNNSAKVRHEFWWVFRKFLSNFVKIEDSAILQFSCRFVLKLDCCWITKKKRGRPNFVGISQIVQKILPHTENLKKILGFFILRARIIQFSVRVHFIFKNALFNFSFNFHRADANLTSDPLC